MMIDPNQPIWQLTVSQFLNLLSENSKSETVKLNEPKKEYVYGLKGLAKILGCSITHASKLKSTGIFDSAIIQNGRKIIIDKEKAVKLFQSNI